MNKTKLAVLVALVALALGGKVRGEETVTATNKAPEPRVELRVVLEKAAFVNTVRLSAEYLFSVKEKLKGEPPAPLFLRLYQGFDKDDKGHDSITRLNAFFDAVPREHPSTPANSMTIRNTNVVTLRMFGSVWLFQDGRGHMTAVSKEEESKKFLEQFGAAKGSQPIRSDTNSTSSAAGSRR